jgi:hypothetical protein
LGDGLAYLQALRKQWVGLITGPTATLILLIWQVFEKTDIPTWVFWVVAATGVPVAGFLAWREEHEPFTQRQKADMRIADKARPLRRRLAASFEEWGTRGPETKDQLLMWIFRFTNGYSVTEPALTELLDLRPDASPKVQEAVRAAWDAYHAAADIVNPIITPPMRLVDVPLDQRTDEKTLQEAVGQVRKCLALLETVSAA